MKFVSRSPLPLVGDHRALLEPAVVTAGKLREVTEEKKQFAPPPPPKKK